MAYNYRIKKFQNGTIQLTYYDKPVLDSFDKLKINRKRESDKPIIYEDISDTPFGYIEDAIDYDLYELQQQKTNARLEGILTPEEIEEKRNHSLSTAFSRTKHMIYDYGRSNIWEWFFTLTLNDSSVSDKSDYAECSKKVRKWFNNLRKICPDVKYLIVPEEHKSGAWHFHALVSNVEQLEFTIARNNQEYRLNEFGDILLDKNGQPVPNKYFGEELRTDYPNGDYIYNISNYNSKRYVWSTATKIKDTRKAVGYIVKYMTKELTNRAFGCKRYFPSRNLDLPESEYLIDHKDNLQQIITEIEQYYGVKVSTEYFKNVKINNGEYQNSISYFEFGGIE